ncbi:uncharacterized protein F5891DRAFT_1180523 [Suillus fuscotomentosus]|uniref:Uncharacterized protein n=1 Tax=Suillus fuscotomentosus TaxID=1912939 RepID=A0AAD4EMJ8_9AGAM|nr:uncharacterized protein F5891DRAFT_1180523 [Suillus fuscotomentosus]KAG1908949.1 hypothetical protein F5891DRAFT_1180523 [Suillus fuscotomentosus]
MPRTQSPTVLSQQTKVHLDKAEVVVLRDHLEDWSNGCKTNLGGKKNPKPLIKYGRRWTARQVLIQTHKDLIREETGEMAGSEEMISKWPKAGEEREQVQATAEKWNNQAAPPEVQAEVAESKGAEMIEHFATKMFKQAGMRVCVLSAWNNSKGKLMLGGHDFNEQFGNGESFIKTRDWDGIFMPEWGEYAGEQFDAEDGEEPLMVKSKKRQPRKLVELEEDAEGWPMLPDTMDGIVPSNNT